MALIWVSATADIYDERIESSMDFISSPYPKELTVPNAVDLDEDNTVDTDTLVKECGRVYGST